EPRETRVAIIGRPNVGKSTLLNQLTGSERAIVSPVPGTTRDAVDEIVERDGRRYRFIDTAGIRRKGKTHLMAEKLSVVMARKHLEFADIALILIDATEGVTALDATIAGYAHESGRSVIIVVNKWDLVASKKLESWRGRKVAPQERPVDRNLYEQQVRRSLKFLEYASVIFISASSGKNVDKIFPTLELVAEERRKRIPTAAMNRFLKQVDFERASVPMAKRVKIYYMTQASVGPPTFVLFTDRPVKLHFSYQRFLENQIRRAFGFTGTPIRILTRASS
ncbi:MAG: ribosome biogenesis GTPase Der, partial [Acidobacteriota bacterium]